MHPFFQLFPIKNKQWEKLFIDYFNQSALENPAKIIDNLYNQLKSLEILPKRDLVFEALHYCDPNKIKVVIIGQDPYPNPQHPCGLAFSTQDGSVPASLRNVFLEIQKDYPGPLRTNGNLTDWVQQGVLLLNSCLTTLPNQANSHKDLGWKPLVQFIIKTVWTLSKNSVFLLWGQNAQRIWDFPDSSRLLKSGHPSPLAYHKKSLNSFKGCQHFLKANQILTQHGELPIIWHNHK